METKGGPIQHVHLYNVTCLTSDDVVVADSKGLVTVFHDGQILMRKPVSAHNIAALQIEKDASKYVIMLI